MQQFIDKCLTTEVVDGDTNCINDNPVDVKRLEGIVVEINDQDVMLSKEDAESLEKMLTIIDKYGYAIKDVIIK